MLKVRIRGVGALASASSLLALAHGTAGCSDAAEAPETDELVATESSALTVQNPGSAQLELRYKYDYQAGSTYGFAVTQTNTDEFIRVGQRLTVTLPADLVWSAFNSNVYFPEPDRIRKVRARITVQFYAGEQLLRQRTLAANAWAGDIYWNMNVASGPFIVPARTTQMRFAFTFTDTQEGKTVTIDGAKTRAINVFGGELPLKNALFDNDFGNLRQRIVEGGQPVQGADLLITYTDWRANTVVDSFSIDREIGTRQGGGRFGPVISPIFGELEHEISYGFAFDDQQFGEEVLLTKTYSTRLVEPDYLARSFFESRLAIPATATRLSVYFHVKTYLVVDYSRYGSILSRRYEDGARILVRDRYDNPAGAFTNYEFWPEPK
jgi:hypothetical protein